MELVFSIIALLIALAALLYSGLDSRRLRVRDLEHFCLERHWTLQDKASTNALRGTAPPASQLTIGTSEHPPNLSDQERQWALLYLRMCDDEVRMRARGLISDDTLVRMARRHADAGSALAHSGRMDPHPGRRIEGFTYLRETLPRAGGGFRRTDPCAEGAMKRYHHGLVHFPLTLSKTKAYSPADWTSSPQDSDAA